VGFRPPPNRAKNPTSSAFIATAATQKIELPFVTQKMELWALEPRELCHFKSPLKIPKKALKSTNCRIITKNCKLVKVFLQNFTIFFKNFANAARNALKCLQIALKCA
jgi:hypothetical protein